MSGRADGTVVPNESDVASFIVGRDPRVHGLITDDVDPAQAVACPVPAGGVTVHLHSRLLRPAPAAGAAVSPALAGPAPLRAARLARASGVVT